MFPAPMIPIFIVRSSLVGSAHDATKIIARLATKGPVRDNPERAAAISVNAGPVIRAAELLPSFPVLFRAGDCLGDQARVSEDPASASGS